MSILIAGAVASGDGATPVCRRLRQPMPFPVPIGYRIDCGFVSVPEDRSQPNSPPIKIGVAMVHSRADQPRPIRSSSSMAGRVGR